MSSNMDIQEGLHR